MNKITYYFLISLLLILFSVTAHAQVLVLKSTGANAAAKYKAGSVVTEDTSFSLLKGDQIVLLSGQATRTFDGPGTVTPAEVFANNPQSGTIAALADFLKSSSSERTDLGAVRGPDSLPADPWVVNVTTPGNKCVISDEPLVLWRGTDIPDDRGVLSVTSSNTSVVFPWPPGVSEADWPEGIDWTPGETFVMDFGLDKVVEFHLTKMPLKIVDNGARLVWLAQQGCTDQVTVLLDRL